MDKMELHLLWLKAHNKQVNIEELDPAAYEDFFTYTDKESYLAWVIEWKKEYRELSEHIRSHRKDMKAMQRDGSEMASAMQTDLVKHSRVANAMIAVRRLGKQHSWGMRNAERYVESVEPHDVVNGQLAV